jgi:50S ribosomal protein L16 3-hydroxylase
MLYLPPHIAHWGIAVGDCMTYSIGFRAPSAQELISEFLNYLQEKSRVQGMYADTDLEQQRHPAELGASMLGQVGRMLEDMQWNKADVARFLGQYLSEPKPNVIFDRPDFMDEKRFHRRLQQEGIRLALKSQLLFHRENFFMNGEQLSVPQPAQSEMRQLADARYLPPGNVWGDFIMQKLYAWYLDGYVELRGGDNEPG